MDIATIIGFVSGFILIILSILIAGASLLLYVDVASAVLVIFGSFFACVAAYPLSVTRNMFKYLGFIFKKYKYDYTGVITTIVSFSEKARREGILALEDDIEDLDEPFLKKGIQMAVDGTDPEIIKNMLFIELDKMEDRHNSAIGFFNLWAGVGPAFGMIGTLLGLIQMLANLEDQSNLASGMALALVTTLYGSVMANLFLLPMRTKLQGRHDSEVMMKEIMIEGILSIQGGDNPRMIQMKLAAFLPPKERSIFEQTAGV